MAATHANHGLLGHAGIGVDAEDGGGIDLDGVGGDIDDANVRPDDTELLLPQSPTGTSPRLYPLLDSPSSSYSGAAYYSSFNMALRSVITLANSIIGVSILAMPFCFKQCGIVLAILLLLLSGAVVKVCCHLLVKSAMRARRRNYELLAFQTFGPAGKLGVEISMIGFLMGTCIAFFVVMGDLAPPIIADFLGVESSMRLRLVILIGLGLFVALPLALLRNVDSLAGLCTASILFYLFVLLYIVVNSAPSLFDGSWRAVVNYWRPAGIFQCLPIFCMALSCQA